MAGAINIGKVLGGSPIKSIDAKSSDYKTLADLTTINCRGYNKLMVYYACTAGWDRAGNIIVYGAPTTSDTFVAADATVENATFEVTTADTGEYYVVENIPTYIKIGWDNTTAGTTGTISVWVSPFN